MTKILSGYRKYFKKQRQRELKRVETPSLAVCEPI